MTVHARLRKPEEIQIGDAYRFEVEVSEPLVRSFAETSGDFNPLHVDAAYARSAGYRSMVAHGALQTAWVSQAVGMWLIGVKCLVRKIQSTFTAPLIYPTRVAVESTLQDWNIQHGVGMASIVIRSATSDETFSRHIVEVGIHGGGKQPETPHTRPKESSVTPPRSGRPVVLLTGATSGLLRSLTHHLSRDYDLIVIGRNPESTRGLQEEFPQPGIQSMSLDLLHDCDLLSEKLDSLVQNRTVWGVIHGASLPILQDSILEIDSPRLKDEWTMTGVVPVRLAQWMGRHAGADGGRIILIGSEATKLLPKLNSFPKSHLYGMGKRLLRETGRCLAQELASRKITVNMVHPAQMPLGMNAGVSPSTLRMWEAENPMKRLCQPADLETTIQFFLSEQSGFISGQELYLNGGRF